MTAAAGLSAEEQEGGSDDDECIVSLLCGVHNPEQSYFLYCRQYGSNELVGFALLFDYTSSFFVSTLCIRPEFRRLGFGSLLMRSGSALAAKMGIDSLTGTVSAASPHLLAFYARLGAVARPLAPCGPSTTVFTRRLDAPSGPTTAGKTQAPMPEGAARPNAVAQHSRGQLSSALSWCVLFVALLGWILYRLSLKISSAPIRFPFEKNE